MNRSPCAIIFALCVLLASQPGPAVGQTTPIRDPLSFDWGLGLLLSIPEEFDRRPCGSFFGLEVRAGVGLEVAATLAVESSLAVTVPRPTPCVVDPLPLPVNGTVTRTVFRDGIDRNPFVSSTHRVIFHPAPSLQVGPRLFLGGGRFWTQGTWFWSAGIGLRLGAGRSRRIIEVERMQFGLPFVEETRVFSGGELIERLSSPEMTLAESVWAVRIRLPVR